MSETAKRTFQVIALFAGLAMTGIVPEAGAGETEPTGLVYLATSVIDGQALNSATGGVAVNQAAGDHNMQYNGAAIAISSGGRADARVSSGQFATGNDATRPDVSVVQVRDGAFAHSRGLVRVNQASGVGNAQVNAAAIAFGLNAEVHSSVELQQSVAPSAMSGSVEQAERGRREIHVDDTAFQGTVGLTQVNQSAGSGNATANIFTMGVDLGNGN